MFRDISFLEWFFLGGPWQLMLGLPLIAVVLTVISAVVGAIARLFKGE